MDYNKMSSRLVRAMGISDGHFEASFALRYNRPTGRPAPALTDAKKAEKWAEGFKLGQERHAADLEVNGKPITASARAINAHYRALMVQS